MKTVIHEQYRHLTKQIESIPETFETSGETIYQARNILKKISFNESYFVVKSFRPPHFINRVVYTFLRKSKAHRSYKYALELLSKQIGTPFPVAFIERKKGSLLCESFFVSQFAENYFHIREQMYGQNCTDDFLEALVAFISEMHSKGILHKDLSPGNILYKKNGNTYSFCVVDINRMKFKHSLTFDTRCKNFERLTAKPEVLSKIAEIYARKNETNSELTLQRMQKYSRKFFKGKTNI